MSSDLAQAMDDPLQQFETNGFVRIRPKPGWLMDLSVAPALQDVACHPEMLGLMCLLLGPNICVRRALTLPDSSLAAAVAPSSVDLYVPAPAAPRYSISAIVCTEPTSSNDPEGWLAPEAGEVVLLDRRVPHAAELAESIRIGQGFYLEYAFRWIAHCPAQPALLRDQQDSEIGHQLFANHGFWNTFGPQAVDVPLVAWMLANGITQQRRARLRFNPPANEPPPRYQV